MNSTRIFTVGTASAAAIILALSAPLAASAHVRVDPDQAVLGSYATLTFTVPTESATAGTIKVEVDLPTDTPFGSVSYQPLVGWATEVITENLATPIETDDGTVTEAPVKVVWTADSGVQIAPGQFQRFVISAGALPVTGSIVLPAHQYYSDGTVVHWDQETPASGVEPEHPAPTVYVNEALPASDGELPVVPEGSAASPAAMSASIGVGVAGLTLGAIALVVAVVAVYAATRRSRLMARSSATTEK